jgi:hypothetical protein
VPDPLDDEQLSNPPCEALGLDLGHAADRDLVDQVVLAECFRRERGHRAGTNREIQEELRVFTIVRGRTRPVNGV